MISRSSRPGVLLLALLGALACGDTPDRARDPATPETLAATPETPAETDPASFATDTPTPSEATLRCRQERFPCTWAEVDPETGSRRSVEMGSETLERLESEAPGEAAERLASLPEVAEATR